MKNRRGLTIVETVIGLTIMAIAFYALIGVFVTLLPRSARIETINKKAYLAQEKIEEFLTRDFGSLSSTPETSFPGSFSDFKYSILVTYVTTSDVNTQVAGPTNFKNIKVFVWGGGVDPQLSVEVVSLVTSYEVIMP